MEAKSVDEIPAGPGWQYEPKWDGFRCLAFRRGNDIYLQSKSGQPLARYFPDIVVALSQLTAKKFVLDGEWPFFLRRIAAAPPSRCQSGAKIGGSPSCNLHRF
jgi:ATP-dependent DNA ligase